MKRTPLKRSSPLKSNSTLVSKPVRKQSKKRSKDQKVRSVLVTEMLEEVSTCQFPECVRAACDVHEILSRGRGGSFLDRANCVCLCRECHRWVTNHPVEAEGLGLLRSSYSS